MLIQDLNVVSNEEIAKGTFLIGVEDPETASFVKPGQFFNIQVSNGSFPLLRRPFSISNVENNILYFMYKVVGEGTKLLGDKKTGDSLNLLGPLGNNFSINSKIEHIIMIGGGIGIAPFPFFIKNVLGNQTYSVLFGVRDQSEAHNFGLDNITYSSDDGSIGLHGNVIDLLNRELVKQKGKKIQISACGPTPMFRALRKYLVDKDIYCEVSMESAMACGFGICQGCPIEHKDGEAYKLICKDGPIFNINNIEI